jgi:hypothetical protein
MRKAYLLFTLFCIGLASCKPNRNNKPTTYSVNNVHDIELSQGEEYAFELFLNYLGPVQENVTLDIEGLPEGISADFSKTGGIPSFTTEVTLRNNSADPGVYNVQLITTGSQTGEKAYDFTITVETDPLCGVLGTYTYTAICDPLDSTIVVSTSEVVTSATVPVQDAVNPVRFENFGRRGWVVTANINCATGKVEIPLQSVGGGMEVSGTGTFTASGMQVSYTIYSSASPVNCNFTLLRSN